jgi:hypothetical protein
MKNYYSVFTVLSFKLSITSNNRKSKAVITDNSSGIISALRIPNAIANEGPYLDNFKF